MSRRSHSFDFCEAMRLLCNDIVRRLAVFRHIEMRQVGVSFAQTRSRQPNGLQAKLTPLRFEDGSHTFQSGEQTWAIQPVRLDGAELLYILTFYLPRFLNLSFHEKLTTITHELFHVSPSFDGDLRRLHSRYHAHSTSQAEYDAKMSELAKEYLELSPPRELVAFLEHDHESLGKARGRILGLNIPIPKLFLVSQD